jgi:selenocysteine lyase/cysteine desulfurase
MAAVFMTPRSAIEHIRNLWPTLDSMTFLNTASAGVPSQPVLDAMNEYMVRRTEANWGAQDTANLYSQVKTALSQLLGGTQSQYAFVASTSFGISGFGNAIEYPNNSNVVLCDMEFPSNYIPWQIICRKKGIELRIVKSKDGVATVDAFADQVDENTRILAVSHVQFGTGYKSDLGKLAKLVHSQNGFLVADIIQSAGWEVIDLPSLDVDFAAGQATKWLAGPIGAGFAYVKEEILDELEPSFGGWHSVEDHRNFEYFERKIKNDASKFEGGSPPLVAYAGFNQSLKIQLSTSSSSIRAIAMNNADYLRKQLQEHDIDYFEYGSDHNSPIVSCKPDNVEDLESTLLKDRIITSTRNGRLRVSPHFYNYDDEIDRLVDRLV